MTKPWYQPETVLEAADCLENLAAFAAFLRDILAQDQGQVCFSEMGAYGLSLLLSFEEDALLRVNKILLRKGGESC